MDHFLPFGCKPIGRLYKALKGSNQRQQNHWRKVDFRRSPDMRRWKYNTANDDLRNLVRLPKTFGGYRWWRCRKSWMADLYTSWVWVKKLSLKSLKSRSQSHRSPSSSIWRYFSFASRLICLTITLALVFISTLSCFPFAPRKRWWDHWVLKNCRKVS